MNARYRAQESLTCRQIKRRNSFVQFPPLSFSVRTPSNEYPVSHAINRLPEQQVPLVLIVDDSEDIREMFRFILGESGYRVVMAVNGQEAISLARTECPDLILMDLSMPVLDGYGAARGIREITKMCDVPIVALSAHDTIDHRAKAFAVGFTDYLTKPVDFINLINLLQRLLRAA